MEDEQQEEEGLGVLPGIHTFVAGGKWALEVSSRANPRLTVAYLGGRCLTPDFPGVVGSISEPGTEAWW